VSRFQVGSDIRKWWVYRSKDGGAWLAAAPLLPGHLQSQTFPTWQKAMGYAAAEARAEYQRQLIRIAAELDRVEVNE
jgi:hypothetical protein